MESPQEAERLIAKSDRILIRRHLEWTGLRQGESFLDVGCGAGDVLIEAASLTAPELVTGADASTERLDVARTRCRSLGLDVRLEAATVAGPGSSPFPDGTFDHAWTRFFLEYVPDPAATVHELARLARPGGKVTLLDIEGNCVWHFGMSDELRAGAGEVLADLATAGFDPHAGRHLAAYAATAGLVDIRHEIEPYHRIVGAPDAATAAAWHRKVTTLRDNYLQRLFPAKTRNAWVFDAFMEFILSEETMTWSLLHLVQGTKRGRRRRRRP
jgi:ubiquinone/menaquinone biosynthesis C-methylase UbiE